MIKNIAGFEIEINKKKIKNIYLAVLPGGKIRISAPNRTTYKEIEQLVTSKSQWIKEQQAKMSEHAAAHEYKSGEILYLFGEKYTLYVAEGEKNCVESKNDSVFLTVRSPDTDRNAIINEWYRKMLNDKISYLFPLCEKKTGLYANSRQIRNMKTRWGSCNVCTKKIWLNLQLAKMPEICLEYVIYHELAHLSVSNHGPEFKKLLDKFMPEWRDIRKFLNKEYPKMK